MLTGTGKAPVGAAAATAAPIAGAAAGARGAGSVRTVLELAPAPLELAEAAAPLEAAAPISLILP